MSLEGAAEESKQKRLPIGQILALATIAPLTRGVWVNTEQCSCACTLPPTPITALTNQSTMLNYLHGRERVNTQQINKLGTLRSMTATHTQTTHTPPLFILF